MCFIPHLGKVLANIDPLTVEEHNAQRLRKQVVDYSVATIGTWKLKIPSLISSFTDTACLQIGGYVINRRTVKKSLL